MNLPILFQWIKAHFETRAARLFHEVSEKVDAGRTNQKDHILFVGFNVLEIRGET